MTRGIQYRRIAVAVATLLLAVGGSAQAASGSSASRSQIRKPISLTNSSDLNFGTIVRGTTAGTVTINAQTAARTSTGGVTVVGATGFTRANFAGSGSATRIVTLSLNAATITLTNGTGGSMTVNTFRISGNGSAAQTFPRTYTLPASGLLSIGVGARLNVTANQADGNYSGTFVLNMNYQ
jgi:hypothetical protein